MRAVQVVEAQRGRGRHGASRQRTAGTPRGTSCKCFECTHFIHIAPQNPKTPSKSNVRENINSFLIFCKEMSKKALSYLIDMNI
jgi:hypothetical protein